MTAALPVPVDSLITFLSASPGHVKNVYASNSKSAIPLCGIILRSRSVLSTYFCMFFSLFNTYFEDFIKYSFIIYFLKILNAYQIFSLKRILLSEMELVTSLSNSAPSQNKNFIYNYICVNIVTALSGFVQKKNFWGG